MAAKISIDHKLKCSFLHKTELQSLRNFEKENSDLKKQIAKASAQEESKNLTIANLEQGK